MPVAQRPRVHLGWKYETSGVEIVSEGWIWMKISRVQQVKRSYQIDNELKSPNHHKWTFQLIELTNDN